MIKPKNFIHDDVTKKDAGHNNKVKPESKKFWISLVMTQRAPTRTRHTHLQKMLFGAKLFEYHPMWDFLMTRLHFWFQVKEYCPLVFRNLRERFGIDEASYLKSLTKPPLPMDPPTGRSSGGSNSKFYSSEVSSCKNICNVLKYT